ncbi:hypothetical protein HGP05_05035 [Streptococcus sanguinis]|uniref:Glucan-binding protein C/Surface antigen I/II V-domain domain-containing protein n=1 Tax=Streptococcus sanguinis TaxID=1305 RepID=A0A7Y0VC33_STRSA|nr:hypothetical protein [Streptococcus sanguinis]
MENGATTSSVELYGNINNKSDWTTNVGNKTEVKWGTVLLERGQSVTATYTNLQIHTTTVKRFRRLFTNIL